MCQFYCVCIQPLIVQHLILQTSRAASLTPEDLEYLSQIKGSTQTTGNIHPYLSTLVNYIHPVPFSGFDEAESKSNFLFVPENVHTFYTRFLGLNPTSLEFQFSLDPFIPLRTLDMHVSAEARNKRQNCNANWTKHYQQCQEHITLPYLFVSSFLDENL